MITNFKMFEKQEVDESIKHTIILDDMIDYYMQKYKENYCKSGIREFLFSLVYQNNVKFEFFCRKCTFTDDNGATNFADANKSHKGVVNGTGYGFNNDIMTIFLNFRLSRIRYDHAVDTSKPLTIFGKISKDLEDIIDDVNMISDTKKYNL